jgi:hypothetical protein
MSLTDVVCINNGAVYGKRTTTDLGRLLRAARGSESRLKVEEARTAHPSSIRHVGERADRRRAQARAQPPRVWHTVKVGRGRNWGGCVEEVRPRARPGADRALIVGVQAHQTWAT